VHQARELETLVRPDGIGERSKHRSAELSVRGRNVFAPSRVGGGTAVGQSVRRGFFLNIYTYPLYCIKLYAASSATKARKSGMEMKVMASFGFMP
jgi:hypothetical protein